MKIILQGILLLFCSTLAADAQRICGTELYKQQLLRTDPALKELVRKIEKQAAASANKPTGNIALRDTAAGEVIYIPVVVHVLYKSAEENISEAQVRSQIDVLNNDFNRLNSDRVNTPEAFKPLAGDAKIRFCLAQVDPQGKRTNGINRKNTTRDLFITDDGMKMPLRGGVAAWDSKRYLNIWVCKLSSRSVGYATPPGAPAAVDGVVIAYDVFGTVGHLRPVFNKGRTATHEVGHWLGLIHTWGDNNCGDDLVEDTPQQESYNFGCQNYPKLSSCSPDGNGDMFMNFMDFSDDACMNLFTRGQVKRMRSLFAQNNFRNSFLTSFACDSTLAEGAAVPVVEIAPPPASPENALRIYPNPAGTATTIDCRDASALMARTINIFNTVGVKVMTATLTRQRTVINLSNLLPGVYIVQLGGGRGNFSTRFIKQ